MAEIELRAGAKIDLLNKHEMDEVLARYMQPQGAMRATAGIRLPVLRQAGANPFTMGGDTGTLVQAPDMGYVWSVRLLVVEGLTAGATPDVVNVVTRNRIAWQLTGTTFFARFGRGEFIVRSGESLLYQSVGTFAATGTITAWGHAEQVPQELEGRFYL